MTKPTAASEKVEIVECPIGTPGSALFLFPIYDTDGNLNYAASEKNSFAIRRVDGGQNVTPRRSR